MQGNKTHEQQLRVIHGDENTKNGDKDIDRQALENKKGDLHAPDVNDMRTGERAIQHGANQESEHNKPRSDD